MRVFITRLIWLCVFPPLVLASWIAIESVRKERSEFLNTATNVANNIALSIDRSLLTYANGLKMLSMSSLIDHPERWHDLYQQAQEFQRSFGTHVILASASGPMQMLFNTRQPFGSPLPVLPRPQGRAAAPSALASGQLSVGDTFVGPVAGVPLVAIAEPVKRAGRTDYLLLTTIETARFQNLIDQTNFPKEWAVSVVDSAGKTIARRAPAGFDAQRDVDDEARISVPLRQAEWSVRLEIPRHVTHRSLYLALARYLGILVLALASSVLAGKIAARRLLRGVSGLLDAPSDGKEARDSPIAEIAALRQQIDQAAQQEAEGQRTLAASESRFTATFEQAAVGIALVATDGHWLRVNRRLCEIVGYSADELMDRTFQSITHPDDLQGDMNLVGRTLAGEIDHFSLEKRYLRKDSTQIWVNLSVALVRTPQGLPDYFVSVIEDIDTRRRAQEELLAIKGKLEAALASMTDAVSIADAAGHFIEFNEAFAAFHRFANKRRCPTAIDAYPQLFELSELHGAVLDAGQWPVARALSGESASNAEFRIRHQASGEYWFASYSFGPIHDAEGGVIGAVVAARDITERQENQRRLRLALDAAKAGTWEWNLKTQKNIWSDETFRLYGLQPGECVPSFAAWLATIHPRDREAAAAAALDAERQSAPLNVEWQVDERYGTTRWLMSRGQPQFGVDGKAERYLGIVMDITERKLAEMELEQHRYHLERLVEQRTAELAEAYRSLSVRSEEISDLYNKAPCGYHSLAPDGVVLAVNDTELELLGYTREEFVGRNIGEFMTPASREAFRRNFSEFARIGRTRDLEFDFVRKNGSTVPVLVSGDLVRDAGGRFMHTRSILIDNSERQERERQLRFLQDELARRAEEAEAATRAKSAFLASMSHEIRTPMNAILGLAHLILRSAPTPEQSERLHKIEGAGRHLLSIINDILDLSKIEAGRVELEHTDFHLPTLLDNILTLVGEQAGAKGLLVRLETDSVPPWLRGDPTRLRQALLNYAGNAVKFTEHGTITVRAQLLDEREGRVRVRFEVADTGIGIPASVLPGLFRSFEQGDTSTTRRYGGTGLGLAITRHLAELMGGEAGAGSTPGAGSTFWLTAVLERGTGSEHGAQAAGQADAEELLQRNYRGARILLAEDDEINREVALALLGSVDLDTDTAATGSEALAKARDTGYDLILMDMQMPEMDGIEATRQIRTLPGREAIPIIAMTANAFDDDRRLCEQAGMNDFIAKPVNPEDFFATLLRWLDARSPTTEAGGPRTASC